ncbi:hypothetical protein V8G54_017675 [Vigna mungo]|uniref:Dof-type domain-containing protein n=1 Tax=Vigna mungo TaxID=3915 RepID=A0AAQ3NNP4_VIGMU
MIQELLGAATASLIAGETKISINNNGGGGRLLLTPPAPSSPSPSPSCTTTPRHFCKTCRRYWTKGGALRNVPIGGGCRKSKTSGMSNSVGKQAATKMKAVASELGRPQGLFDQELPQTPILWGSPQNTQLMALLRATQSQNQNQNQNSNPNPNPSLVSIAVKVTESFLPNGLLNSTRTGLGYDGVGELPSLGLCSSFWRNNQNQNQQQSNGFVLGEQQSNGVQELYHKFMSSSSVHYCGSDNSPVFLGNMPSSSSLSNILESSSVSGSEFGCWNPTLSWGDLPTTSGAYP